MDKLFLYFFWSGSGEDLLNVLLISSWFVGSWYVDEKNLVVWVGSGVV